MPRAVALLDEARASTGERSTVLDIDELAGHIATRQGPVMRGHAILTAAAERADPERAIAMLAEATSACFYAGDPTEMLVVAERASSLVPTDAAMRTRFLASIAIGMARIAGGDAAAGTEAIQEAVAIAGASPEVRDDLQLVPWLALAPIFLREAGTGRALLDRALEVARERSAIGALPLVLDLIALDHATTDRWAVAEATYQEAIGLARETGQQTDLVFGLSGLARLQARRGHEHECRANVAEALQICDRLGTRLHEVWALEALGMLELGLGEAERAVEHLTRQQRLVRALGITDPDLSPAPELIDACCRLGRVQEARESGRRIQRRRPGEGSALVDRPRAPRPGTTSPPTIGSPPPSSRPLNSTPTRPTRSRKRARSSPTGSGSAAHATASWRASISAPRSRHSNYWMHVPGSIEPARSSQRAARRSVAETQARSMS